MSIHPTAIVSSNAKIGSNNSIAPYSIIEDDVEIGNDCEIGPNAVLYNGARIGNKVIIKQNASVANVPQDLKFSNEKSLMIIGDHTVVRESVTLHRGTVETGLTKVGKNCLLMAYCHIPHDCIVGDSCIIANSVQIAGHCIIEDYVILGGLTGVHQFSAVGEHSMVGGASYVNKDIPPYVLVSGNPIRFAGLNVVGLRRRGFKTEDIDIIKKTYTLLYDKGMNISQAMKTIDSEIGENEFVKKILNFISRSKRGIVVK